MSEWSPLEGAAPLSARSVRQREMDLNLLLLFFSPGFLLRRFAS